MGACCSSTNENSNSDNKSNKIKTDKKISTNEECEKLCSEIEIGLKQAHELKNKKLSNTKKDNKISDLLIEVTSHVNFLESSLDTFKPNNIDNIQAKLKSYKNDLALLKI